MRTIILLALLGTTCYAQHIPFVGSDGTIDSGNLDRTITKIEKKAKDSGYVNNANTWTKSNTFNGFTVFGSGNAGLKIKRLTGTTAATEGGGAQTAHGVTSTKVVGGTILVQHTSGEFAPPGYTAGAGYQYDWYIDPGNVNVINHATNSENILGKPFVVILFYIE